MVGENFRRDREDSEINIILVTDGYLNYTQKHVIRLTSFGIHTYNKP